MDEAVAIIGMSGRFPEAENLTEFWQNLCQGKNSISFFDDSVLLSSGISSALLKNTNYIRARGILRNVKTFDYEFFGIGKREATLMDPQHRLFLECAWEAFENAGYIPIEEAKATGVYIGKASSKYLSYNLDINQVEPSQQVEIAIGNEIDAFSTTVAHRLNLIGPAINIQTFCSTSLVAVHVACQNLLNYECDMAIAGGAHIDLPQEKGYLHENGSFSSPDGYCRAFDSDANGTPFGNGLGVVLLKRYKDALRDHDHIYSIIKGSATNNDGAEKAGYTAPSTIGQSRVIIEALDYAGIPANTIGYVEAHGTGTALGDPIEIAALTAAFQRDTAEKGFCYIGSLKPNIGHLDRAAGIASLIKAALILYNKKIPPTINFITPNPNINFPNSPFVVNTSLRTWEESQHPHRAAVSAFGIGGTNAHIILEEPPLQQKKAPLYKKYYLLPFSARTHNALYELLTNFLSYLKQNPDIPLTDFAHTLQTGRKSFEIRVCILAATVAETISNITETLNSFATKILKTQSSQKIVFICPGLGEQHLNLGKDLYFKEKIFQNAFDECARIANPMLGEDIRSLLHLTSKQTTPSDEEYLTENIDLKKMLGRAGNNLPETLQSVQINQTEYAQPLLFIIGYALAMLWKSWGIKPDVIIGYSLGEYLAAHLAGIFNLQDALCIVIKRAQLINKLEQGKMIAVHLSEKEILSYLSQNISLAAVNSEKLCVLSGSMPHIEAITSVLDQHNVTYKAISTTHAFHSEMMRGIIADFRVLFSSIEFHSPKTPLISNVTGKFVNDTEMLNADYWINHLCNTVQFYRGIELLLKEYSHFIELGSGGLGQVIYQSAIMHGTHHHFLASLPHYYENIPERYRILETLGKLWTYGFNPNWIGMSESESFKLPLPTYPFQRELCWIEHINNTSIGNTIKTSMPLVRQPIENWLYEPVFLYEPIGNTNVDYANKTHIFFALNESVLPEKYYQLSEKKHTRTIWIKNATELKELDHDYYELNWHDMHQIKKFIDSTKVENQADVTITVFFNDEALLDFTKLTIWLTASINLFLQSYRLTKLILVTADKYNSDPIIFCFSGYLQSVSLEHPNLIAKIINFEVQKKLSSTHVEKLIEECLSDAPLFSAINYKNLTRYCKQYRQIPTQLCHTESQLKPDGIYVITGGLGGLGLKIAHWLLTQYPKIKLVLITRRAIDNKNFYIKKLSALHPENILIITADIIHKEQVLEIKKTIHNLWGHTCNGLFHLAAHLDDKFFMSKNSTSISNVLNPKVSGLNNLMEILPVQDMDFVLLFSSLAAITGNIGQADYCAANAYMDHCAYLKNRQQGKIIAINWDVWQEHGFAANMISNNSNEVISDVFKYLFDTGIKTIEGLNIIDMVLSNHFPANICVSTKNINAVTQYIHEQAKHAFLNTAAISKQINLESGDTKNCILSEELKMIESVLLDMWQELLYIDNITAQTNFFSAGGHSLVAIKMMGRIREAFQIDCPMRVVFIAPTIQQLTPIIADLMLDQMEIDSHNDTETKSTNLPFLETKLPNGLALKHFNPAETMHFYHDIFEQQTYTSNGICLGGKACVLDIGANIGLFSLYIAHNWNDAEIYAFEPAPEIHVVLKQNLAQYSSRVHIFNAGVSSYTGKSQFNYVPNNTGMSSFYNVGKYEENILKQIVYNQEKQGDSVSIDTQYDLDEFAKQRLINQKIECDMITLSDVISKNHIEKIDLIKIDVQKSELDVLNGIDEKHWKLIHQFAIEVHDLDNRVIFIDTLLKSKGFSTTIHQDDLYKDTDIYLIYATRKNMDHL